MNFNKMSGTDWAEFLVDHPERADKCKWSKFEGYNWCYLLRERPEFSEKCDWSKLDGNDWASLLKAQPQFADKCDWSKLDGYNWANLLSGKEDGLLELWNEPNDDRSSEDGGQAAATSEFADKCAWSKLNGDNWRYLLSMQPQYADKCDWSELDGENWVELLGEQPQFADKCAWSKLDGGGWCYLLGKQPQFADKCDWSKLDGCDWRILLQEQPQFADKCDWSKLDNEDWNELLESQPQFVDKRPKTKRPKTKNRIGKIDTSVRYYEKEIVAEVLREKQERAAASKAVKAVFDNPAKRDGIDFCGFYPGMAVDDVKLLAAHYGLEDGQWSVEPFGTRVYKLTLSTSAIRAITKCGETFDDLAHAVADRTDTLELMEDDESGLVGYGYILPPLGQLLVISENGDLLLENTFIGNEIAVAKASKGAVAKLASKMVAIPGKHFSVCRYPVTQALWFAVMGENPSLTSKGPDLPVTDVVLDSCRKFLEKLNALPKVRKSGLTYRLPTVKEWEYACRAGAKGDYCMLEDGTEITDDTLDEVAWYEDNSDFKPHPVGEKEPNAFGLYDMNGNVWEITSDVAPSAEGESAAVCCGGSWNTYEEGCTASARCGAAIAEDDDSDAIVIDGGTIGVRLVC